jgi:uncharacterized protein YecT (DUF1311 family)
MRRLNALSTNADEAQRAWNTYRDRECEVESEQFAGGSEQPTERNGCQARLAADRLVEVQQTIDSLQRR